MELVNGGNEKVRLFLASPIYNNELKEIDEIILRRPTGAELLNCGFPFAQERHPQTRKEIETVQMRELLALAAASAGVPMNSLLKMDCADLYEVTEVMRFFFKVKRLGKPSNPTSQPDGGAETAPSSSA